MRNEGRSWVRRITTVGVIAALFTPLLRNADGLPLSTYPMYAGTRAGVTTVVTASGRSATGDRVRLTIGTVAATRDPLIAQSYLSDAVGRGDTTGSCIAIASRADPNEVVAIDIAVETIDVVARVLGEPAVRDRRILATCAVEP